MIYLISTRLDLECSLEGGLSLVCELATGLSGDSLKSMPSIGSLTKVTQFTTQSAREFLVHGRVHTPTDNLFCTCR